MIKDAFSCFHTDMKKVRKYMKPIRIGKVEPESDINPNDEDKVYFYKTY